MAKKKVPVTFLLTPEVAALLAEGQYVALRWAGNSCVAVAHKKPAQKVTEVKRKGNG